MIPGRMLHRIAARIYSAKTFEHVIEPAIADLQREYLDASIRGYAATRKLVANYLAVLWVISICTLEGSEAMDEERDNIGRMLFWACLATGVLTILLTLPPLSLYPEVRGWQAFLAVVPQALPLAIPVGLAFAFAVGPSAAPTVRVYKVMLLTAFVASLLSFGVMAWGMPAGNQAFRELAFQAETRKAQRTGGGALETPLRKGANEMTLSELRREIRNVANVDEQRRYSWTFHLHFTLPAAALAIAVFMVLVPVDGRLLRGLLAFAACFVYWALIFAGEFGVRRDYLMPVLGAWLPNLAFVAVAVLIGLSRSRQFLSAAQG